MRLCFFLPFILYILTGSAQTYRQVKQRFNNYLNYKGGLNKYVEITEGKITFFTWLAGKKDTDLILTKEEWSSFAAICKTGSPDSLEKLLYSKKGKLNLPGSSLQKNNAPATEKPLSGKRIALDPGHMAGNMEMARVEQKYLHFTKTNYPALISDSLDIAEGTLTFQTAAILKKMLEEKGAEVFLTRLNGSTSFRITYDEWVKKNKRKVLDSLLSSGKLTKQKHAHLLKLNHTIFFRDFFKDFELQQRILVINQWHPDLTMIIHYNVDEKNTPWLKPTSKNYCMAFIPGCIINDNLETTRGKINLLRLLLTDDPEQSEKMASLLVSEFSKQLKVPVAKPADATYLSEHCTASSSPGVYSRNLALCRLVQSPLAYGECLYQDNETECYELVKNDTVSFGIKTNKRVTTVAQSYLNAILSFYAK